MDREAKVTELQKYSRWDDIPSNIKTKTSIKQMGLKLKRGQQPVAVKTSSYYKTPDYNLYDVGEAVPNIVTDKQRQAVEKAKQESLKKRTCTRCGWVEELGRDYRRKVHVRNGICDDCADEMIEQSRIEGDKVEASEWSRGILKREDVLILDSETTDLHGEIIELAIINLKGEVVFNRRFNPTQPVSAGAKAVHGISTEMLANEPRFAECASEVHDLLNKAGEVLIYNAAFDTARLAQTYRLHGVEVPTYKSDCIMEWYAQWCGQWSDYHGNYKWQPLGGGHDALGDCRAALACLQEMAKEDIDSDNPSSER